MLLIISGVKIDNCPEFGLQVSVDQIRMLCGPNPILGCKVNTKEADCHSQLTESRLQLPEGNFQLTVDV